MYQSVGEGANRPVRRECIGVVPDRRLKLRVVLLVATIHDPSPSIRNVGKQRTYHQLLQGGFKVELRISLSLRQTHLKLPAQSDGERGVDQVDDFYCGEFVVERLLLVHDFTSDAKLRRVRGHCQAIDFSRLKYQSLDLGVRLR